MQPIERILGIATAGLLLTAAVALANTRTYSDPRGDVPAGNTVPGFDFRSATTGHGGRDVMTHRITSWNADRPSFERVRLELDTGGPPSPDYYVKKTPRGAGLYNARTNRRVAGARYVRHSLASFSLTFSLQALGFPGSYTWRWRLVPATGRGTADLLPNRGFIRHDSCDRCQD